MFTLRFEFLFIFICNKQIKTQIKQKMKKITLVLFLLTSILTSCLGPSNVTPVPGTEDTCQIDSPVVNTNINPPADTLKETPADTTL